MKNSLYQLLIGVTVLLIFTQCKPTPEVNQWWGPNRDGFYPDKDLLKEWPQEGPKMLWKNDHIGLGYSSVAIAGNKIFTAGMIDSTTHLFALSMDGLILWDKALSKEWTTNYPGTRSTPLIYEDKGYHLNGMGKLNCFNIENGEIIWQKDLMSDFDGVNIQYGFTENLVIEDDMLFCCPGGKKSNIIALNKDSGELIWESPGDGAPSANGSPVVINHNGVKYLLVLMQTSAISINIKNGEIAWKQPLETKITHASVPVFKDGYLLIIDSFKAGASKFKLAEDGNSVHKTWQDTLLENEYSGCLVINNRVYGSSWTKMGWICLDWETGEQVQTIKTRNIGSIISADGLMYCNGYGGEILLVQPTDTGMREISSFQIPQEGVKQWNGSFLVIHEGRMYVRYYNELLVYDISK